MSYTAKHWVKLEDFTVKDLNILELGLQEAHDDTNELDQRVANLTVDVIKNTKKLNSIVDDSSIALQAIKDIEKLLIEDPDLSSILKNYGTEFLTKTPQSLTDAELRAIYKNLHLTDYKLFNEVLINGEPVNGTVLDIAYPTIDTVLNNKSNNPISNAAVAKALEKLGDTNISQSIHLHDTSIFAHEDLRDIIANIPVVDENKFVKETTFNKVVEELRNKKVDLSGYALIDHNHDDKYSDKYHNHDDKYSFKHSHPYALDTHHHDSQYANINHEHTQYATTDFVEESINSIPTPDVSGQINTHNNDTTAHKDIRDAIKNIDLSGYALIDHNHDGVYALATHTHPYALENHTHNYSYYQRDTIDLSDTSIYDENKYYPCTSKIPVNGLYELQVAVQLNSGTKPSWSTHDSGFTYNLSALLKANDWGVTNGTMIIFEDNYSHSSIKPGSLTQLTNSGNAVLWLRGGGKYFVFKDWAEGWNIHTTTADIYSQTIAPTETLPASQGEKVSYESHTHNYLPLSGGTMTGKLSWSGEGALPQSTNPQNFLVIDNFSAGGATRWVGIDTVKTALGVPTDYATSSHNHDGVYAPATHSHSYATQSDIDKSIANLVGAAPESLDTIYELADALKNEAKILDQYALKNHNHDGIYLPLTAGSSKKLTGTLYADTEGIVVGHSSTANNTMGIVFGTANSNSRIGANSKGALGIYARTELYMRPGVDTDASAGLKMTRTDFSPTTNKSMSLGTSSYNYNNLYATTIYEANTSLINKYVSLTSDQTISGIKTFSKASGFNYTGIEDAISNTSRNVWFSHTDKKGTPCYHDTFKYNPSTDVLTVGSITGNAATATKATNDSDGNAINATYSKLNGSNNYITLTDGSGNNTSGYRLVSSFTAGTRANYRLLLSVKSRHQGTGLVSIGLSTHGTVDDYKADINYWGSTIQYSDGAWRLCYNPSTALVSLYWYYIDYSPCSVSILQKSWGGDITNGTWTTSIPESAGTQYKANYNFINTYAAKSHTHNYAGSSSAGGNAWKADCLAGFTAKGNQTWGNQTGSLVLAMDDDAGGSLAFRKNNPSSGKLSMVIDGTVYINEGNDEVATKSALSNYVPLGTTNASTVSSAALNSRIINIEDAAVVSGQGQYTHLINLGGYKNGSGSFASQIAMPYINTLSDSKMFIRTANGETWRDWREVITTGNIATHAAPISHTHSYITSKGALEPQQNRTQALGDVYTYNTYSTYDGKMPTSYTSVIGFGRGTAGTVEIAGCWISERGLWYRALRDCNDNWWPWKRIITEEGGTINGNLTVTGWIDAHSDERLKENIINVDDKEVKDFIENIKIKAFNYKDSGNRTVGILAQHAENLEIDGAKFTSTNEDGYLQVHENKFVYLLWNYCQQLNKRIKELEGRVK